MSDSRLTTDVQNRKEYLISAFIWIFTGILTFYFIRPEGILTLLLDITIWAIIGNRLFYFIIKLKQYIRDKRMN